MGVVHSPFCCRGRGLAMGTPSFDMALRSVSVMQQEQLKDIKSKGWEGLRTQGRGPWRVGSVIPCAAAEAKGSWTPTWW